MSNSKTTPAIENDKTIQLFLKSHSGWALRDTKLYREFRFKNFAEAFGFMTEIASIAERLDHHPEWCNVYNRLTISLTTHEVGSITQRDFDLAQSIDSVYSR